MADYEFRADLLDEAVRQTMERLEKQMRQYEKTGDKTFKSVEKTATTAFKKIESASSGVSKKIADIGDKGGGAFRITGESANLSAAKIGAIGGIVGGLTNQFIEMGREAIQVLIGIGERSIQTALEFDTLRARLLGIFEGSQEAADATFAFIRERSKALGIDLGELAGAFLPKTESLAQFERVAKIATALAASDPEQGAIGARIALIEALSGTFTSLQRRFEIPKEDVDRIKEAFDTEGIEGFLSTLEKVLAESGKDFDTLADTAQTSFNQLGQAANEKLGQLGDPIVESLERAAENIGAFLEQNDTDITLFVTSIGDAIASVIDFVSSIDFSQIDTKSLVEFGQYIFRIVEATKLFIGQAVGFVQSINQIFEQVTVVDEVLGFLADTLSRVDEALVTASQILALSKAGFEAIYATIQPLVDVFYDLFSALGFAITGNFSAAADSLNSAVSQINAGVLDLDGGLDAAAKSLRASAAAMAEYGQAVDDQANSQEKLRAELEDTSTAGEDAANAILAQKQAAKEAEQALSEYEAALEKVNEKQAKLELELERAGGQLILETERKRLDAIQDFADKRVDQAKKALQRIEDVERDNTRSIEDIDRDAARRVIDDERETAQKRLSIEEKFSRRIAEIRRNLALDQEEAALRRDAVEFVRLARQAQRQEQEAQQNRTEEIQDAQTTGEQRREELRIQLEREKEDQAIALSRKFEDARIADERELEALRVQEQRKLEEIELGEQRQRDDLNTSYQQKLTDLQTSLAAELAIIQEYEAQKTQAVLTEATRRQEIARQAGSGRRSLDRGQQSRINQQISQGRTVLAGRASGGPVSAGGIYPVGERGPELFVPDSNGTIVPSSLMMGTIPSSNVINNITTNNTASMGGLIDPNSLDAILTAKVQNILVSLMGRM